MRNSKCKLNKLNNDFLFFIKLTNKYQKIMTYCDIHLAFIYKEVKDDSALRLSEIEYKLIKKLGPKATELIRYLACLYFKSGRIPKQWKYTQLYPIPKPQDWNYQMIKTRLIVLIECLKKMIVKLLNN